MTTAQSVISLITGWRSQQQIAAGMSVTVESMTGRRRLIEYFLSRQ